MSKEKTIHELAKESPDKTYVELEKDRKLEREHKLRQEAEGELSIMKGIETNRVKEAQARSNHLQKELDRVKKENNDLFNRVADALEINESHQKLNGKLQERLTELEQENIEVHADNIKLARQVEDRLNQLRKAGL
jgi:hypothetical protein